LASYKSNAAAILADRIEARGPVKFPTVVKKPYVIPSKPGSVVTIKHTANQKERERDRERERKRERLVNISKYVAKRT
jgi:hypothetical protein